MDAKRVETIAQSTYWVLHQLAGERYQFDSIDEDSRQAWRQLVAGAESLFQKYEGAPWGQVAREVRALLIDCFKKKGASAIYAPWHELLPGTQLVWEALARHLACLLDEQPEAEELAALEDSWQFWHSQRVEQLTLQN